MWCQCCKAIVVHGWDESIDLMNFQEKFLSTEEARVALAMCESHSSSSHLTQHACINGCM